MYKNFGDYIYRRRKLLKLSQEAVGKVIGYTPQSVSLFEHGDNTPGVEVLPNLGNILKCSVYDLFTFPDKPTFVGKNKPINVKSFAYNIKKIRKMHKLTQKDESDLLDTSIRSIRNYETGQALPNYNFLSKFIEYYRIKVEDVINDIDHIHSKKTKSSIK